jgi:peroxiredoxin family protein
MSLAKRERLCIVLLSGSFERVHYALCMASAAAALERPVTLFVTLGALCALVATDKNGRPGWMNLPGVERPAASPAADGAALDALNRARGVAGFDELLRACTAFEVEFMVCEMGLRTLGLTPGDLRSDVRLEPGGLASLFARGGQIVVL